MWSSGFTDAPVSRILVFGLVIASLLASILDIKHYFYIHVDLHLWRYHQLWRILSYQFCYTNSAEVLFGAMTIYNLRVIERLWGSKKFASFVFVCYPFTTILPPLILGGLLRPLSLGWANYLPAGPTPLVFALLAQYHAAIPHFYRYRLATSASPPSDEPFAGLTFSDKSYVYFLAVQLSLSQFPGSLLGAFVGWAAGYSYRNEVLPMAMNSFRLPGWMVGIQPVRRGEGFEGLRRRLEGENAAAATGSDGRAGGQVQGRSMMRQLLGQFRGT